MRKATFDVPAEAMAQFTDELANRSLDNTITGTNKYNEIIVEVMYKKDETDLVDELEDLLDKFIEEIDDKIEPVDFPDDEDEN